MADPSQPVPFRIAIPEEELARMKRLLQDSRLPEQPFTDGVSWEYGVDLNWLKEMKQAWLNDFDWREVEQRMNEFQHFKANIEGVSLHFIHQRSQRHDAVPILMSHGWPGTCSWFLCKSFWF